MTESNIGLRTGTSGTELPVTYANELIYALVSSSVIMEQLQLYHEVETRDYMGKQNRAWHRQSSQLVVAIIISGGGVQRRKD